MTITDFVMLQEKEQLITLLVDATRVTDIVYEERNYVLYSLDSFFVELEYMFDDERDRNGTILIGRETFASSAHLDKYIEKGIRL